MSDGGSLGAFSDVLAVLRDDLQGWLAHARETYAWGADAGLALSAPGKLLAATTSSTRIPQGFWALLSYEVACYCAPSSHEVARFRRLAIACELLLCSLDYFDELEDNDSSATRLALGDGRLLNCATALYQQGLQILAELDENAVRLATRPPRLFSIASRELSLAMSGQHLDLLSEQQVWDDFDIEGCIGIIAAKSGSLCRMVCCLACAVAGADARLCELFAEIGTNIGIAAQLENDIHSIEQILDGEQNHPLEKTDILRVKKTMPLVLAFNFSLQKPVLSADTTSEGQDQHRPVQIYRNAMQQTWASALLYRLSAAALAESITQLLGRQFSPRLSAILGIDIEAR